MTEQSPFQPIELYGARTGNCLRVAIAFEESQLPYCVRIVDLQQGEHHQPPFKTLNPDGKVPVIVDRLVDGTRFVLTQSNAILFYIADRVPGRLLPVEPVARAVAVERFFYFLADVIGPSHGAFFLRKSGAHAGAEHLDAQAVQKLISSERFLVDHEFMAGDAFSMADIAAFTIARSYDHVIDWNAHPLLNRWRHSISRRPSVLSGLCAFDPPLVAAS
jgi:GST-like protein